MESKKDNKALKNLLKQNTEIKKSLIEVFAENFFVESCKTLMNNFEINPLSAYEAAYILLQNPDFDHTHMDQDDECF